MSIKTRNSRGNPPWSLLATLAAVTVISPFATDLYLPSFPEIIGDLKTDASFVQLTLTTFLIGVAAGQLLFGPLSDRFGRKGPLLAGTALCAIASVVATFAPTIEILVISRFAQGFAGAAGIVISRAIVADLYPGRAAARAYSLLAMLTGLAPILAPMFGGILADPLGWRGLLGVLAAITIAMFVVAIFLVPETNRRGERWLAAQPEHRSASGAAGPRLIMLRRPGYIGNTMVNLFAFACLMGYIAASPFIFQNLIGLSPLGNGLMFAAFSVAMIGVNSVNARFVMRVGPRFMMRIGLFALSIAIIAFAVVVFGGFSPWLMIPCLLTLVASNALLFGNSTAMAMQNSREATGTGAAILGAAHFIGGAAVAPLVGIAGEHTAVPLAIVLLVSVALAWAFFAIARIPARGVAALPDIDTLTGPVPVVEPPAAVEPTGIEIAAELAEGEGEIDAEGARDGERDADRTHAGR